MFMMVVGRLSMMMHKVIMLFFKTIFALSRIVPGQNNGDSAAVKLFTNRTLIALLFNGSLVCTPPLVRPSCLEDIMLRLTIGPTWELILMISAVTHIWITHYCKKIIKFVVWTNFTYCDSLWAWGQVWWRSWRRSRGWASQGWRAG